MNEQAQIQMYGETVKEMIEAVLFADLNDPYDIIAYASDIITL
jgi:hypothetical protein